MKTTKLDFKKLSLAALAMAFCLVLVQVTCAYANGRLGETFDDGNNDGKATYPVEHLKLVNSNYVTGADMIPVHNRLFWEDVKGNVSTTVDGKIGDGNTYVFSDDQYCDIKNLSLNCGERELWAFGVKHIYPFISLAYANTNEPTDRTFKYTIHGRVEMWFDGQVPICEDINLDLCSHGTLGEIWDDPDHAATIDGYHNEIIWVNTHQELGPTFEEHGMEELIHDGKFRVTLDSIDCVAE